MLHKYINICFILFKKYTKHIPYFAKFPFSLQLLILAGIISLLFLIITISILTAKESPAYEFLGEKNIITPTIGPSASPTAIEQGLSQPLTPNISQPSQNQLPTQSQTGVSKSSIGAEYVNVENQPFYPPSQIATLKNVTTGETKTYTSTPSFFESNLPAGEYEVSVKSQSIYDISHGINGSKSYTDGLSVKINLGEYETVSISFRYIPKDKGATDTGAPSVQSFNGPEDFSVISTSDVCVTVTASDNITKPENLQLSLSLNKGPSMGIGQTSVSSIEKKGLDHCFNGLENGFYVLKYFVKDEAGNSSSVSLNSFEVRK